MKVFVVFHSTGSLKLPIGEVFRHEDNVKQFCTIVSDSSNLYSFEEAEAQPVCGNVVSIDGEARNLVCLSTVEMHRRAALTKLTKYQIEVLGISLTRYERSVFPHLV